MNGGFFSRLLGSGGAGPAGPQEANPPDDQDSNETAAKGMISHHSPDPFLFFPQPSAWHSASFDELASTRLATNRAGATPSTFFEHRAFSPESSVLPDLLFPHRHDEFLNGKGYPSQKFVHIYGYRRGRVCEAMWAVSDAGRIGRAA